MPQRLIFLGGIFLAVSVIASLAAIDNEPALVPLLYTVSPEECHAGDVLSATGANLDKALVQDIYLTNGKIDVQAKILEQKPESIRFKIPEDVAPGRYRLMVLTKRTPPMLLEQGVVLKVLGSR